MTEKLDMKRLFVDALGFLRGQTLGLLLPLFAALALTLAVRYAARSVESSALIDLLVYGIELVVIASVGVVAYRRGLDLNKGRSLVAASLSLALAQGLVRGLFLIIGILLFAFLAILAGILLSAVDIDLSVPFTNAEDFYALVSEINTPSRIILGLLLVASCLGLLWTAARLFVFGVATVAHERLMIFRTWGWTKGHATRIMAFTAMFMSPVWVTYLLAATHPDINMSIINGVGSSDWQPDLLTAYACFTALTFLLGHAAAAAVYKQLGPEIADYEAAFA